MKKVITEKTLKDKDDFFDLINSKVSDYKLPPNLKKKMMDVPLEKIEIYDNVRKVISQEEIESMARSLETEMIHPVTLQESKKEGIFELLVGQRRFLATRFLYEKYGPESSYGRISAIVFKNGTYNKEDIIKLQIIENFHRKDVTTGELVKSLNDMKTLGMTYAQIGKELSMKESYIKDLFQGVHTLEKRPALKETIEQANSSAGATILGYIKESRSLPEKIQLKLITDKLEGRIKNRAEFRDKVNEIKDQYDLKKRERKEQPVKELYSFANNVHKIRALTINPEKLDEVKRKELITIFQNILTALKEGSCNG